MGIFDIVDEKILIDENWEEIGFQRYFKNLKIPYFYQERIGGGMDYPLFQAYVYANGEYVKELYVYKLNSTKKEDVFYTIVDAFDHSPLLGTKNGSPLQIKTHSDLMMACSLIKEEAEWLVRDWRGLDSNEKVNVEFKNFVTLRGNLLRDLY